jgi:Protein of unknown function (DUF2442)
MANPGDRTCGPVAMRIPSSWNWQMAGQSLHRWPGYPRLLHATPQQRSNCSIAGAGYGIHWPEIDEDLSVEGLLRVAPAPRVSAKAS